MPGDCFAFVAEPATEFMPGDVLNGEVVRILPNDRYLVRVFCAEEETSEREVCEPSCLTERLSRRSMDEAAAAGWPQDVDWLRALLAN